MSEHVKIAFYYDSFNESGETDGVGVETAWAIQRGDYFELDNLLFFAQGYALGDIIEVKEENQQLFAHRLVEESGHSLVRIFFYEKDIISSTRDQLKLRGCDSELSHISLISVDIPPAVNYPELKVILDAGEASGKWAYEEACLSDRHKS